MKDRMLLMQENMKRGAKDILRVGEVGYYDEWDKQERVIRKCYITKVELAVNTRDEFMVFYDGVDVESGKEVRVRNDMFRTKLEAADHIQGLLFKSYREFMKDCEKHKGLLLDEIDRWGDIIEGELEKESVDKHD